MKRFLIMLCRVRRQCYTYKEIINTTEDRNYEFKAGGAMRNMDHLKDVSYKDMFSSLSERISFLLFAKELNQFLPRVSNYYVHRKAKTTIRKEILN